MIIIFLLRPPALLSMRRGDLLMFINLLVSVIYLVIDNIKKINLTQNMKIKKYWHVWLRGLDLNLRPSGYEPDSRTFIPIKTFRVLK